MLSMQVGGGLMFLIMMLRPFLKHISKESRRCAELLAQLPPDMDVEGMVAATWTVVKEVGQGIVARLNLPARSTRDDDTSGASVIAWPTYTYYVL